MGGTEFLKVPVGPECPQYYTDMSHTYAHCNTDIMYVLLNAVSWPDCYLRKSSSYGTWHLERRLSVGAVVDVDVVADLEVDLHVRERLP